MIANKQPNTEPEKEAIFFRVPANFKLAVDLEAVKRRISLQTLCIEALAKYLRIPMPGTANGE